MIGFILFYFVIAFFVWILISARGISDYPYYKDKHVEIVLSSGVLSIIWPLVLLFNIVYFIAKKFGGI